MDKIVEDMDKIVEELNKIFHLKDSTVEGDIVVIVTEKPQSLIYALVTGFEADVSRKEEWWHVSLQLLTVPPQKTAWTLRTPQFTGKEIFTMGGEKRYIKAVDFFGPKTRPLTGRKKTKNAKIAALRVVK